MSDDLILDRPSLDARVASILESSGLSAKLLSAEDEAFISAQAAMVTACPRTITAKCSKPSSDSYSPMPSGMVLPHAHSN